MGHRARTRDRRGSRQVKAGDMCTGWYVESMGAAEANKQGQRRQAIGQADRRTEKRGRVRELDMQVMEGEMGRWAGRAWQKSVNIDVVLPRP